MGALRSQIRRLGWLANYCLNLGLFLPTLCLDSRLAKPQQISDTKGGEGGGEGEFTLQHATPTLTKLLGKKRWSYGAFCFYYIYYGFSCSPFLCATHPVEEVNYWSFFWGNWEQETKYDEEFYGVCWMFWGLMVSASHLPRCRWKLGAALNDGAICTILPSHLCHGPSVTLSFRAWQHVIYNTNIIHILDPKTWSVFQALQICVFVCVFVIVFVISKRQWIVGVLNFQKIHDVLGLTWSWDDLWG